MGLVMSALGQRTLLPRVTLLLILGAVIGKEMLDIIPPIFSERFDIIAVIALLMVGFLLGGRLTIDSLRQSMGSDQYLLAWPYGKRIMLNKERQLPQKTGG